MRRTGAIAVDTEISQIEFASSETRIGADIKCQAEGAWATGDTPGRLVFSTTAAGASTPTERMRITSDAYIRLASGTGGIQFNGDTAEANALDDYEEGTFTPYLSSDTGGEWPGKTTGSGFYTKIGRIVHVHGQITWSSQSAGAAGTVRIFGLPFGSTGASDAAPYIRYNATELFDAIRLQSNASLSHFRAGGSEQSPVGFSANGDIAFNFIYRVS